MSLSEKARALVFEYVSALLDDATTRTANLTSPRFLREQKARRELDDYVAALEAVATAARKFTTCTDHADNCCADWCHNCRIGEAHAVDLNNALAALDAAEKDAAG